MVDYKNPNLLKPAKIRWFGYQRGDSGKMERTPRIKGLLGYPGFDATCTTCGWDSAVGQGVESEIKRKIENHKSDHDFAVRLNSTPEENDARDAASAEVEKKRREDRWARRSAAIDAKYGITTNNPNLGKQFD